MDWSVGIFDANGAAITGASALTTLRIRRVADNYLYDFNDSTFKNAGWVAPTQTATEVSAVNFPGIYVWVTSEAAWNDGDYQGIVKYAGTPAMNESMLGHVRDGKDIDVRIGDVVEALPTAADIDTQLSGTHGAGAWDSASVNPQDIRDAMTLAPTPGVPAAGSVDALLVGIDAKTTNLPSDPADESLLEAAISAIPAASATALWSAALPGAYAAGQAGKIVGDNLDAKVSAAVSAPAAALTAYDAATAADVTASEAVITGAIAGLNDLSSGDVQTAAGAALTAYDAATGADIAGLNNLSSAQAQAASAAALTAYDAATGTDVSTSEGVITGAIGALNDISSGDVQTAAGAALTAYDAATGADVAGIPAATDVVLTAAHGAGAWDGVSVPLNAQQTRDAMKLAPSVGAPAAGSIDTLLGSIDGKTTNLPADPADQSAVEAAITASQGVITGAIAGLNDLSSGDVQTAAGAALTAYDAATAADVSAVPAATDVVLALAHGAGAWDGLTPPQTLRDAMTLAPTPGVPAAGSVDALLGSIDGKTTNLPADPADQSAVEAAITASQGVITGAIGALNDVSSGDVQTAAGAALTAYDAATGTDVSGVPAATDVVLALAHGAGAWDGMTPPQTLRDAMTLAPTPGVPAAGSVDALLVGIDSKTTNLPSDPADQSAVEAAITAGLATLNDLDASQVQAANAAALVAYGVSNAADITNIRSDISGLNDVSAAQVRAEADAALAAYDGPTNAELTAAVAPLATSVDVSTAEANIRGLDGDTLKTLSDQLDTLDTEVFKLGASMSDDGLVSRFILWGENAVGHMTTLTGMTAVVRSRTALVINLGIGVGPDANGCFVFSCSSAVLPFNDSLYLVANATDGSHTYIANAGLARVR